VGLHWDRRAGATEQRPLDRHKKLSTASRAVLQPRLLGEPEYDELHKFRPACPTIAEAWSRNQRERESVAEKRMPIHLVVPPLVRYQTKGF
jgi:hypothetical protein